MKKKLLKSMSVFLMGTILAMSFVIATTASESSKTVDPIEKLMAAEENLKAFGTEVIHEEIAYQILDVQITKEIGDYDKDSIIYFDEETDEIGNLTSSHQYLWLKMKIKNLSDEEKDVCLNKYIYNITSDNYVLFTMAEARYISPDSKGFGDPERFFSNLKSQEETEILIGYILNEIYTWDSPLYYCLSFDTNYSDDLFLYLGTLTERTTPTYQPEELVVNSLIEASMQETEWSIEELSDLEKGYNFVNQGAFTTTDTHIGEQNQPIIIDQVLYQILDVEITKEIGDHDPANIDYGYIEKDENGNLTGASTFIWLTMRLKNFENTERSFWLNKALYGIDENNIVYETLSLAKYIDPVEENAEPYRELFLTLQGGEEREVTLGYIIADESKANCRSDLPLYYRTELYGDRPSFYLYVGELTEK